jgi:hypothetical protein
MASADPILQDEYDKYVFDIQEQGGTPMTIEEFRQQAISGMAEGGIARLGYRDGYSVQGGVKNYLGDQETVSNVPVKWRSGPDTPETELAYITDAEKNLLLKKDIHGSNTNGPNKGPGGVMSLNDPGTMRAGSDISAAMDKNPDPVMDHPAGPGFLSIAAEISEPALIVPGSFKLITPPGPLLGPSFKEP